MPDHTPELAADAEELFRQIYERMHKIDALNKALARCEGLTRYETIAAFAETVLSLTDEIEDWLPAMRTPYRSLRNNARFIADDERLATQERIAIYVRKNH